MSQRGQLLPSDRIFKNNVRSASATTPLSKVLYGTFYANYTFMFTAYTFHVYGRSEGCAGVIISDHEYPKLVAHKLLTQVMDDFLTLHPRARWATGTPRLEVPALQDYITKYQDPRQADSILKIQQELDETKIVLHQTIESVLERGTKIENLVERSEGLSAQSKLFYTQVRGQRLYCNTQNTKDLLTAFMKI